MVHGEIMISFWKLNPSRVHVLVSGPDGRNLFFRSGWPSLFLKTNFVDEIAPLGLQLCCRHVFAGTRTDQEKENLQNTGRRQSVLRGRLTAIIFRVVGIGIYSFRISYTPQVQHSPWKGIILEEVVIPQFYFIFLGWKRYPSSRNWLASLNPMFAGLYRGAFIYNPVI